MIEQLLPDGVACVDRAGVVPSARLLPEEALQLGRAVERRVQEFSSGRACARQALLRLGLPSTPILRGLAREPLWPPGVVGSITHCSGYRAAAVAFQSQVVTIGIDAEVHDVLPAGVLDLVSSREERALLEKLPAGVHWDRLMFSAKESLYKAWFPLTGRWLDFCDVVLTFEPIDRIFHARLLVDPPVIDGERLTDLTGRFMVQDGLALTAIAMLRKPNLHC